MNARNELWGLTTLFNPTRAQNRLDNYRAFRARSRAQGLPLVTVELAFGDADFQLEPEVDAERLVQVRSDSVLWQKERMLTLGLAQLPADCEYVCWADADVLFEDDAWIGQSIALLRQKYAVIQPFSACIRLPEGGAPEDLPSEGIGSAIPRGTDEKTYVEPLCSHRVGLFKSLKGTTGYVWCARRDVLDEAGFYDRCIVGGGDREMALAFMFKPGKVPDRAFKIRHPPLRRHIAAWHERVYGKVAGRVGYRKGAIYHLWHGSRKSRNYVDRHQIVATHDFDPDRDVRIDDSGCLVDTGRNPGLAAAIHDYFHARSENG